jgi:hypothetical protein
MVLLIIVWPGIQMMGLGPRFSQFKIYTINSASICFGLSGENISSDFMIKEKIKSTLAFYNFIFKHIF